MRCAGGHEYDAISSSSFDDPGLCACPACGSAAERVWTVSVQSVKREKEASDYEPLELEEHLDAKAHYESAEFQEAMRKDEKGLIVRGPQFLRPRLQEKRLF